MTRKTSRFGQAPAIVIAIVALFAAISGTAAALPGTQTVNSGDIKNNNVKSIDLKDGAAVAGADVIDESIASVDVTNDSLTSDDVKNQSLTGNDVQDNSLTGNDIAEATLGQVPDAAKLDGKAPTAFLSSSVYKTEAPTDQGTLLGDGTHVKSFGCDPGDVLLSGGPANMSATSDMVESFPTPGTTNSWTARIDTNAAIDNYTVVILCIDQA